ncbi:MAG TPA: hypothetical protein VKV40_13265 [Ktedonobacteraceae bacterium]|nr:hypothetical protein [Ktedonobacteraceae bacterium]
MFAHMLVRDNRPEAVSSAHWGDRDKAATYRLVAVSPTYWGDAAITSSDIEAVLNLLATNFPTPSVQYADTHNAPGSLTCKSRILIPLKSNESIRKKQ